MAAVILIFVVAVILPSLGLWWLFRERGFRLPAAIAGGQLLVTPAMVWVAWHEATPGDRDAWGALAGVGTAALVISIISLVVIERWTGRDFT
jgi:hypothetical protein